MISKNFVVCKIEYVEGETEAWEKTPPKQDIGHIANTNIICEMYDALKITCDNCSERNIFNTSISTVDFTVTYEPVFCTCKLFDCPVGKALRKAKGLTGWDE